ncbi:hypothetical protein ABZ345_46610 [Lentzea sp. NPDC005914]|uniref:hypothetical protein n=1 Tax=Lentzea sp. NPDC005914 TaxID=3154572 RepID=UPI0033E7031B
MTHSDGEVESSDDDAVQLLKTEYQMLGSYDTSAASTLASIGSIGLVALFFVAKEVGAILAAAPLWIQACAPLVPLAYLAVLVYFTALISFRAKQFREVERELNHRVRATHTSARGRDEIEKTILAKALIPGTARAHLSISRPRPSEPLGWLLTFGVGLVLVIFAVACIGLAARLIHDHPILGGWLTILYCVGVVLVLICAFRGNMQTTSLWKASIEGGADTGLRPEVLVRFLLPRLDGLAKLPTVIFPVVYVWAVGTPDHPVTLASIVFTLLVFEMVLYQARYSWNDLRGAGDEESRGDQKHRARLPHDLRPSEVLLLLSGLALRLALWLAVCLVPALAPALTAEDREALLHAGLAVVALGVLYEVGRTAGKDLEWQYARRSFAVLSVLTAGGYAARGYLCAVIAGGGTITAAVVAMSVGLFGLAYVQIVWALEAMQFLNDNGDVNKEALSAKPHVWYAATASRILKTHTPITTAQLDEECKDKVPQQLRVMWPGIAASLTSGRLTLLSGFQLVGILCSALAGFVVARDGTALQWSEMAVLAGGVLWGSGLVVLTQTLRRDRLAGFLLPATGCLLVVLSVPVVPTAVRPVLPVLFVACGYGLVASQTADQASQGLKSAFENAATAVRKMFLRLAEFALGAAAWKAMGWSVDDELTVDKGATARPRMRQ